MVVVEDLDDLGLADAEHALSLLRVVDQQDPPPPQKCCFTNPGYSGVCEIQPAKDETCATILAYLNNPMAQGKNYCGNTQVRSGWKSVACERK